MWKKKVQLGEEVVGGLSDAQIRFLTDKAHPRLDAAISVDQLKHFADVWWNLCQWEKQRADVLDGKAQSLVGLASIASALVGLSGVTAGSPEAFARAAAACMFL